MKNLLLLLALWIPANDLLGETAEEKAEMALLGAKDICDKPPKQFSLSTSDSGFMGIGGVAAKSCPKAKLVFIHGDYYGTVCFKGSAGKTQVLGPGEGMFSPDCTLFYFSNYQGVSIYASKDGTKQQTIKGNDPVWLPHSEGLLYYQTGKGTLELLEWTKKAGARSLGKFSDYKACQAPGEGVFRQPPALEGDRVVLVYPTKGSLSGSDGSIYRKAKKVTVDLKTAKLLSTEDSQIECE